MYEAGIFVFGTKIFSEESRDNISSLPLEISWKIFTYLDDASLRNAGFTNKIWRRIILSNKSLRRRLNNFGLILKLGSEKLAKFYRKNRKILKKNPAKNYLSLGESKGPHTLSTAVTMKFAVVLSVFVAALVAIECSHTFLGTNIFKQLIYHREVKYSSSMLRKRVEYFNYTLPSQTYNSPVIQGILAYDLVGSTASANITAGGIGYRFVNLRMKSERGSKIDYDVYIYA